MPRPEWRVDTGADQTVRTRETCFSGLAKIARRGAVRIAPDSVPLILSDCRMQLSLLAKGSRKEIGRMLGIGDRPSTPIAHDYSSN